MKKSSHIQVESQGDKLAFVFYKHAVSLCRGLYESNMLAHVVRRVGSELHCSDAAVGSGCGSCLGHSA